MYVFNYNTDICCILYNYTFVHSYIYILNLLKQITFDSLNYRTSFCHTAKSSTYKNITYL